MTKAITLFVLLLSVLGFAEAANPVVQCGGSNVDACGQDEDNTCDAKVQGDATYAINDILKVTYDIAAPFESDLCDEEATGARALKCAVHNAVIFVTITAIDATDDILEITQGGAEALCPENCIYDDGVTRADVFNGICQPGLVDGSKCVKPDGSGRPLLCSAPLGFGDNEEAVVTVECHSGSCMPPAPGLVVQCVADTSITPCGLVESDPCDVKVNGAQTHLINDILKITYDIPKEFEDDVCNNSAGKGDCDPYSQVIYFKVSATDATKDIEISQSGAQALCPESCLLSDASTFTGICQSGETGETCMVPDTAEPRDHICSEPLGSGADAVVTVECHSGTGPSCPDEEVTTAAPSEGLVVQCAAETPAVACGATEDAPCDAKVKGTDAYSVDDVLKVTYDISADFKNDQCDDDGSGGDKECAAYSVDIFVKIVDTGLSDDILEISQGGAEALCPENCLYDDSARADAFSGICQPGGRVAGKKCVSAEDDPRPLLCSAPLGSDTDAVVTVECHSGSCMAEDESSTAEPEEESSTSTGIDGGSAFALTSGAAVVYASLLVAAMHEA